MELAAFAVLGVPVRGAAATPRAAKGPELAAFAALGVPQTGRAGALRTAKGRDGGLAGRRAQLPLCATNSVGVRRPIGTRCAW